jgi:hypothetical protein
MSNLVQISGILCGASLVSRFGLYGLQPGRELPREAKTASASNTFFMRTSNHQREGIMRRSNYLLGHQKKL